MNQLPGLITTTNHIEIVDGEKSYHDWQLWSLRVRRKIVTLPDVYKAKACESDFTLQMFQKSVQKYPIITGSLVYADGSGLVYHTGGSGVTNDPSTSSVHVIPVPNLQMESLSAVFSTHFQFLHALFHFTLSQPSTSIDALEHILGMPAERIKITSKTGSNGVVALRTLDTGDVLIDTAYSFDKPGRIYVFAEEFEPWNGD